MKKIVLASHNQKKVGELRALLPGWEVLGLGDFPEAPAPEETGTSFAENAAIKALDAAKRTGEVCLADDSGLCVVALGGAPGVISARFAGEHGDDAANNERLLRELAGVPEGQRDAWFACAVAVARGSEVVFRAEGRCRGRIVPELRGGEGFGYDPLFVPDSVDEVGFVSDGRTFGELSSSIKNLISHRAVAMRDFVRWAGEQED